MIRENLEYINKNIDEAKRYFELASQNNYSHGTTDLARCLMEEDGDEDKITDLFLLALQQDYERTFRDLVELGFDIKALKEEHVLKKDNMVIFSDISTNCGLEIVRE